MENFRFGMTKVYSKIPPPHYGKLQIWDDQSLLRNTPPILENFRFGMTSLLRNTPPPIMENFRFGMTKVYSEIPPPILENFRFGMTKVYCEMPPPFWKTSDLGWPKFTPKYPPIMENFRFGMTKVYSEIPPPIMENFRFGMTSLLRNTPPLWKTSDLGWPKFTPKYPPIMENFRFGMTTVYSEIPPPIMENFRFGMTSLLRNTPPLWKTSDLGWPKFTPKYPPIMENFRFGMTKVYSEIPPHYGKLQIWDDQSLLWNTPPFWKTSDLGWPKFTPKYPPILENFRFGMTKVYSEIPPHYGKLQIWDDQSLLRNTPTLWKTSDLGWPNFTPKYPPIMENFRFGMTKVYSEIPLPPPIMENFRFGMTTVYSEIPPPPIVENFRFGMIKVYSGIPPPPTNQKLSESSSLRFSEYRELLHVETLSNRDNYWMCCVVKPVTSLSFEPHSESLVFTFVPCH